ncbi:hypothetical protein LTS09_017449 [Friedmanniomyces endolithicus]|nr:hypothetical protein LTS09_017449 [Friedmanniomyces endolithicus]
MPTACERLLTTEYSMPGEPAYQRDRLAKVLKRVRFQSEARVVRDVMPIIVPSPELLHIDGHAELDNVCEAMNAEWTQCDTLCGPRPKPDFVSGISAAAFTKEEKEKLQLNHTSACPNLFPENMYSPFLICEVKGSDRPIEEAERQAMHSASIATRAVIELLRKVSATAEVHEKIPAFSGVHNHSMVMISAHFATIDGDKTSFFRRLLHLNRFAEDLETSAWTKAYKIIRAIYEHFVPQHLDRIRSALSKMRSPSLPSFATQLGMEDDSQASTPDQSSSQEDGRFKKPCLPSVTRLQEENDKPRDNLVELLRDQQVEARRQREGQHEQRVLMEKQLAQQKEEFREQKIMMEKQLAQQQDIIQLLTVSKASRDRTVCEAQRQNATKRRPSALLHMPYFQKHAPSFNIKSWHKFPHSVPEKKHCICGGQTAAVRLFGNVSCEVQLGTKARALSQGTFDCGAQTRACRANAGTITWQRLLDQTFEHTALAGGLVTVDDDLRQGDGFADSTRKEPVDLLQHQRLGKAMLLRVVIQSRDRRNVSLSRLQKGYRPMLATPGLGCT